MYLKYGSYSHGSNECAIAISKQAIHTPDHGLTAVVERWEIMGELHAATVAALTTAINALEAAYATHGGDLALYEDGGTITSHAIISNQTNSGTKIVQPPHYPEGKGAEYATFRSYAIVVEAERPVVATGLISYAETISTQGTGGPEWGYLLPITGPPQPQVFTQFSIATIVQEGYAVALDAYPLANPPVLPNDEIGSLRRIRYELPRRNSQERISRWSYTFQGPQVPGALRPRIR